jgi:hypothetical protein
MGQVVLTMAYLYQITVNGDENDVSQVAKYPSFRHLESVPTLHGQIDQFTFR